MEKQPLLNTYVNNVSMSEAIQEIEKLIVQKKKSYIVPINVDVVVKIENDSMLKEIVNQADMVLVDGKPLVWISKLLKKPVKEKISGSDLVPVLCETAERKGYSLFLLGGKEGIAEQAKQNLLVKYPNIRISGTYAPFLGFEKNEEELTKINNLLNNAQADILIVCLGCPKQEKWVYENYQKYDIRVSICAGATVDFLAENVKRAPKWMSNAGLEWFYRFMQEPKRMFRRYFVDDIQILKLIFKYRNNK